MQHRDKALFWALLSGIVACSQPPTRVEVAKTRDGNKDFGSKESPATQQPNTPQSPSPGKNSPATNPGPAVGGNPNSNPNPPAPVLPTPTPKPGTNPHPNPNPTPVTPVPDPKPNPTPMPMPDPKPMPTPMPEPMPGVTTGDCGATPAINNIHKWWATTEGEMTPNSGTLVKKEYGMSVARVTWKNEGWHVNPVWLGNVYEYSADLSKAKTFTLSYQAPGDFYVQMRPAFQWSGGQQWGAKFEKSPDKITTKTIPFDEATWTQVPGLEKPTWTVAKAQAAVRGFVIVGKTPGTYVWTQMIIDGFTPPCN